MTGEDSRKVSTLELFFDLVFVFAFTQVTLGLSKDPTYEGLGKGFAVFLLLWWAWGAYAWLTTVLETAHRAARLVVIVSMAAMLLVAFAVPTAYDAGAWVFAAGWTVVMVLHALLFWLTTKQGGTTPRAVIQIGAGNLVAGGVLFGAAAADGTLAQVLLILAAVIAYATPYIWGVGGFSISPSHFAERHGLIVIIALGESIVAAGAGAGEIHFDARTIVTVLLALLLISALWWSYFDATGERVEQRLHDTADERRARLARDVYSYLHIPLVFGVVMVALGLKKTLAHPDEPLSAVAAVCLAGGAALYFLALAAIMLRCRLKGWDTRLSIAIASPIFFISHDRPAVVLLGIVALLVVITTALDTWLAAIPDRSPAA
ncbi:low temperature requirement protein A [Nocardioides speluncae]|uniref:low temperature requirement protein A n=1 Tax=Nocardioides speluncae TaxID=2670337 RepID=UPI000D690DC8|nr:low temperature requirement protein A [Nocardioides speluncae]